MKPVITIAAICHDFQRRFCWMLSSLAQQTRPELIAVDVAHVPGNGLPTTEDVCALFSDRLTIHRSKWNDMSTMLLRGIVRNQQIRNCQTEWLMFADCDMVYHPEYFERLCSELDKHHRKATYMVSSGRTSNPKESATALVDSFVIRKANEVPEAWRKADVLEKRRMANVGAGYSQIINYVTCPHGGYYVDPGRNADKDWKKGSDFRSDIQFRCRVNNAGGPRQGLPRWFTRNAIHLNHSRDREEGRHLGEQR